MLASTVPVVLFLLLLYWARVIRDPVHPASGIALLPCVPLGFQKVASLTRKTAVIAVDDELILRIKVCICEPFDKIFRSVALLCPTFAS